MENNIERPINLGVVPSRVEKAKDLLPCPLCGGEEIYYAMYQHRVGDRYACFCSECSLTLNKGYHQTKGQVRNVWNDRNKIKNLKKCTVCGSKTKEEYELNIKGNNLIEPLKETLCYKCYVHCNSLEYIEKEDLMNNKLYTLDLHYDPTGLYLAPKKINMKYINAILFKDLEKVKEHVGVEDYTKYILNALI